MFRYKKLSLNRKIMMITAAAIVPMICLVCYLLWTISYTTGAYADITNNVAKANEYVRDFKERIDYTTYLAVINNKKIDELDVGTVTVNGILTVDPYAYIDELKSVCNDLAHSATVELNRSQMVRLKNTLNTLSNCIHELENNIGRENSYDQNMDTLDNDVYALTSLVQSCIRDYIYAETLNFDQIKAQLDENNRTIFCFTILASLLVVILTVGLSVRAARNITGPIRNLCMLTCKVAGGDFTAQTKDVESGDEIALLMDNFNDMTKEIGQLVEDMKRNHETLRLSETKLLQAQINPHFLYNTLDPAVWLAEAKQNDQVIRLLTYLSDFFRTSLSNGQSFITIQEEQRHIESYLKIQQFRYQDTLAYNIDIDKALYNFTIPKLLLQPLVENALVHGIRGKRGKGTISVTGRLEGDNIVFCVTDDGVGMDEEKLYNLRKASVDGSTQSANIAAFGVGNVNERIHIYYGENYGLFFKSQPDVGTTARIVIPTRNVS